MEIKLHRNISKSKLNSFDFTTYAGKIYTITKNLYKNIIAVRLTIFIKEREFEYEVFDRTNQKLYLAFYNNINAENNLVATEVISKFNDFIAELQDEEIIQTEEE